MKAVMSVLCAVVMMGCAVKRDPPKFYSGDIVEIVITGERAQVYSGQYYRYYKTWRYWCRVSGTRERAVYGVVSQRTATQVYPLVRFREFELREASD